MPPICTHLSIAHEAMTRFSNRIIDQNRGDYYLGSTAPDMRFFVSASRDETHFISLNEEDGASGVMPMLRAHPELGDESLSPAARSFVAGYLSHLVTDEAWIYLVYRPYFGELSPLAGTPMANLLDRVLQFELDRQVRLSSDSLRSIREDLASSDLDLKLMFIDTATLKRWREFVFIATTRKAHWEDFRRFAEKYLIWMRQIAPEEQAAFFDSFDSRLEQVLQMVPEARLDMFREQSVVDSVRVAGEYLQ